MRIVTADPFFSIPLLIKLRTTSGPYRSPVSSRLVSLELSIINTVEKMKFSIKDFFIFSTGSRYSSEEYKTIT